MNSIIGISVRGKTYYFQNTFSNKQLFNLKQFVSNYQILNPTIFDREDSFIIDQFIHDANKSLKCNLNLLNIKEIYIIK